MTIKRSPSTRNMMVTLAHGSRISALCHHDVASQRNEVNHLRHTQMNILSPSIQHVEKAVTHMSNDLNTVAHQGRFNNIYQDLQTRTQETGKRSQQLKDSVDHIFTDLNSTKRNDLNK